MSKFQSLESYLSATGQYKLLPLTSLMMVVRELVRRHRRMPSMFVVDNGKEFQSKAFDSLCHLTRTSVRFRPPHEARFGSVCERMFGTTNTRLIHNLLGNTKALKAAGAAVP